MTYSEIALKYCKDITSGAIPSCRLVKLACQRHLNDLLRQDEPDFPYIFNPELKGPDGKVYYPAERRCAFSEKLPHVKGKWSGKKLKLEPHQIFIQAAVWGWIKKKNGKRRFNVAFIEEPRKNGKSVDAATTGLYMLVADGEQGAEIYSGATTEKQALEVFRPAWQMANNTPDFKEHFGISLSGTPRNPTSIYKLSDMSRFEPIVGNPGDGASPHCAIEDEFHEHKTSAQYDTMETGMGSREQPLMYVITTAGIDTSSPCYDMHLRAIKVLEGTIEDDAMFCIIFGIDPKDDFKDFNVWKKANPNYGVSIEEDYLYRKYIETMTDASRQNINLCKHLNQWTNAGVAWMNMVKWAACTDPSLRIETFKGHSCYMSFDLASKIDLCALMLLFEFDRGYATFGRYYLPEETAKLTGNDHYVKWIREGRIVQTPGASTDYKYIEDDIRAFNSDYPIIELSYDPHEATYLINNIMEWIEPDPQKPEICIEINQGPALMSEPMKELEALIHSQRIWYNGDPVLTWMMGNVVRKAGRTSGPVKYYYPTKERAANKIDGPVALIMNVGRAMLRREKPFVYQPGSISRIDVDDSEPAAKKEEIKPLEAENLCKRCGKDTKGREFCPNCGLKGVIYVENYGIRQ
jgi:phage terminase large subunit-like protein